LKVSSFSSAWSSPVNQEDLKRELKEPSTSSTRQVPHLLP